MELSEWIWMVKIKIYSFQLVKHMNAYSLIWLPQVDVISVVEKLQLSDWSKCSACYREKI